MPHREDFLLEIHTEELPPKALTLLGTALQQDMQKHLQKKWINPPPCLFMRVLHKARPCLSRL